MPEGTHRIRPPLRRAPTDIGQCSDGGFDAAAVAGQLSAVVRPSTNDCGHEIEIVDSANIWKGYFSVSQKIPNDDSFEDAEGQVVYLPPPNNVMP